MAPVMVLGAVEERVIPGTIVSSVPVRVIPEATTGVAVLPEYTSPLKESGHWSHPAPPKFRSTDPELSPPLAETKVPVAVFPEPSIAVTARVFPVSRVPLRVNPTP